MEMVQGVPAAAKGSEKKVEESRRIMYNEEKKYSGFLHIRCKCGAEKSFFTKTAQAFGRAMINCHSQIKSMEKEAYENGFNDGEDWADTINVVTTMMALRRLYGFSTKRLLTVMQTANEYVKMANRGEMSVLSMMQDIEENTDVIFDEMNKNLVKKMGV